MYLGVYEFVCVCVCACTHVRICAFARVLPELCVHACMLACTFPDVIHSAHLLCVDAYFLP